MRAFLQRHGLQALRGAGIAAALALALVVVDGDVAKQREENRKGEFRQIIYSLSGWADQEGDLQGVRTSEPYSYAERLAEERRPRVFSSQDGEVVRKLERASVVGICVRIALTIALLLVGASVMPHAVQHRLRFRLPRPVSRVALDQGLVAGCVVAIVALHVQIAVLASCIEPPITIGPRLSAPLEAAGLVPLTRVILWVAIALTAAVVVARTQVVGAGSPAGVSNEPGQAEDVAPSVGDGLPWRGGQSGVVRALTGWSPAAAGGVLGVFLALVFLFSAEGYYYVRLSMGSEYVEQVFSFFGSKVTESGPYGERRLGRSLSYRDADPGSDGEPVRAIAAAGVMHFWALILGGVVLALSIFLASSSRKRCGWAIVSACVALAGLGFFVIRTSLAITDLERVVGHRASGHGPTMSTWVALVLLGGVIITCIKVRQALAHKVRP